MTSCELDHHVQPIIVISAHCGGCRHRFVVHVDVVHVDVKGGGPGFALRVPVVFLCLGSTVISNGAQRMRNANENDARESNADKTANESYERKHV